MRSLLFALLTAWAQADFKAVKFLPDLVSCKATLTTDVPAVCRGKVAEDQKLPFWSTRMDFYFDRISKAQWQVLRDQYTAPWAGPAILNGQTPLFEPYDASRKYSLMDFLPVNIRALSDYNFEEEDEPFPAGQPLPEPEAPHLFNQTMLVPNCWATVYEVLRTIKLCRGDATEQLVHDVFSTDDKDAQAWLESATTLVPGPYTESRREFGDVLFVYLRDKQMKRAILEHAVMFVDQDIVFEKAGTGPHNPYRLTDVATVEQEWKPLRLGGLFDWEVRRPHFGPDSVKPFKDQFSLLVQQRDGRWPQFWHWPKALQQWYTLAVGDNPRTPGEVNELTLLKARRYRFQKHTSGVWRPEKEPVKLLPDTVLV